MNTIPQSSFIKRRIVYVDDEVQKGLLIALVMIEILLVAGTLRVLYSQMGDVVEANLYRVHFSGKPHLYPLLLETALIGLSGLVAINVLMLWIAGWVWMRHVNSIVKPLRELLGKDEALDFSEDAAVHAPHKVVDLALAWRHTKRQRMLKLRTEIAKLSELGDLSDAGARHHARASLEAIRKLLPN
ncbi:MAG: hypothetical protein NUV75_14090 [Gallionella sp.]|nr:hypothetical protein [Gallionella sp.]